MTESELDQTIAPIYKRYENPVTTVLAHHGDIQVHLRARCPGEGEAMALLAEVGAKIEAALGDRIISRNGDPLEAVIGKSSPPCAPRWRWPRAPPAAASPSAFQASPAAPHIFWAAS